MLKLNIPNLEAIRNWCNEKFQPKGNYITKSEISNEVNETEITLSDLSETVPEAISAMSEEKKLKNLLSHIKAFMTGSKALIDLCVTTGMITQQNINDENKVPSAALLYSLNDALNGQVAQINSNLNSKAATENIPYGFRNISNSLWGETNATLDNANFGLSTYHSIGNVHTDINTWYVLTFYEGGITNKNWGVQIAIGRWESKAPLLVRVKFNGVWMKWYEK